MSVQRIGIDIGGTKILGVALDRRGEIVAESRVDTSQDYEKLIAALKSLIAELGPGETVGLGVPGPVSSDGVVQKVPNLPALSGVNIDQLQDALSVPVAVENDAKCAALAEWNLGQGKRVANFVSLTIGTGVGAGVVSGGRLLRGSSGYAGEVGHMIVDPEGIRCPCGQHGCWEQYASGSALTAAAEDATRRGWLPLPSGGIDGAVRRPRGEDLVAAAREENEQAVAAVDAFARWIAVGLVNLSNLLDTERYVISGGMAGAADVLLPRIEDWHSRLWNGTGSRRGPEMAAGLLGERAGAIGAAFLEPAQSTGQAESAT